MELTETVKSINTQLRNLYGIDTISGKPMWRVIFTEDEFETRRVYQTDEGLQLTVPAMRTVPKYKNWVIDRYILERLVVVPEMQQEELTEKISYEPMYIFESPKGDYLPPKMEAAQFVIDTVLAATGRTNMAKYVEGDPLENKINRVNKIHEQLYGDETEIGDALSQKRAIIVP